MMKVGIAHQLRKSQIRFFASQIYTHTISSVWKFNASKENMCKN